MNYMRLCLTLCSVVLLNAVGFAQPRAGLKPPSSKYTISWFQPGEVKSSENASQKFLNFTGAQFVYEDNFLPRFVQKVEIGQNDQSFTTSLINPVFQPLTSSEISILKNPSKISAEIKISSTISIAKKQKYGVVSFIPIRKNPLTGAFEKLVSFDLEVVSNASVGKSASRMMRTYASNSVLQSGNWYKIALATDGIYKLSYSFFQSLGYNPATLNPQNIRIYGNGGGMLPEANAAPRKDDLVENAISFQDLNSDGVFDPTDYFLFYGKGPNTWRYDSTACPKFAHTLNLYSDSAYYYITADLGAGKRIQSQASSLLPATKNVTTFDDYAFHEYDNINFIKSGREWYGEYFENIATYNFSFFFPNIDGSAPARIGTNIASRDISSTASYSISCQSGSSTISISSTPGDEYSDYAISSYGCFSFNPSNPNLIVNVTKLTADAVAWLDYIDVNVRRQLLMSGNQMAFRDAQSMGAGNIAQYSLTSNVPVQVWDITDPANIRLQTLASAGTTYQFTLPADSLKQFVAFDGTAFYTPGISGTVANQNLHALSNKNMIIVTYPDFYDEAMQLAAFHETHDTLSTIVVTTQQIYNEFSSGAQDICAIRDFVKMFYDRATTASELPEYLLLFGDGSYDNKKRFSSNTDYIPTYESYNSSILTNSFVSDDFYGCLDNTEGTMIPSVDAVDLGVGRFPVKSNEEAAGIINKILYYTKTGVPASIPNNGCSNLASNSPYGDWRNMVCFIADDEDGDLHISDANKLATIVDTTYNNYNVDKIYLDAYPQEATPGGDRYPGVTDAINKRVEKGCLIMNYTGHGGEVGLAHERIVEISDIDSWDNINNLPLFFTATCEFSRFDDPEATSAGELVLLNPKGGGIALFTTVRLVFASGNYTLNRDFYNAAFTPIAGKMPRLGDLFYYIKNQPGGNSTNSRNFTLLGDPALKLAYPKYNVSTDTVNHITVSASSSDTLKALSLVTVSGFVRNGSGSVLNSYNGVIYPTVYDKKQNITTLSNDGPSVSPPFIFSLQKNILYKGKASVTNGFFRFSFVVPKDIAYQYGIGRISYYAENGTEDASGYYEKVIIGGSSDSASLDVTGPT
ncbi:MAG: type IX secretion system sortase PorU, partial [Bacteroidia bacterium]